MDRNSSGWIATGIVGTFLTAFVVISAHSHFSELKEHLSKSEEQSQQLQKELDERSKKMADLESRNTGLSSDLENQKNELSLRLEQVRKLQTSVKTVGRCLIGTLGAIDALQKDDAAQARESLFLIEATCQESSNIIKQVEGFPSTSP